MQIENLAGLNCRIVGGDRADVQPEAVVVLCHGFGAGGNDLVPLAGELLRLRPAYRDRTLFVFPEGPLTIPEIPGGRCWWPIDLAALQLAAETGTFREMRQDCPPMLPEARKLLSGLVDELKSRTEVPLSRFLLGGFSQGSMLATDVSLRLDGSVGALAIYSGTLVVEPEWRELAPRRNGLRVLQSHGTTDPLLPFRAAEWLRDLLESAGADVRFLSFPGPHTIPAEAVVATAELLDELLDSSDTSQQ